MNYVLKEGLLIVLWVLFCLGMALGGTYGPDTSRLLTLSAATTLLFVFVAAGVGLTMPFAHHGLTTNIRWLDSTIFGLAAYFGAAVVSRLCFKHLSHFGDPFT